MSFRSLPAHLPADWSDKEIQTSQNHQPVLHGSQMGLDPARGHQQWEELPLQKSIWTEQISQHPEYTVPGQETKRFVLHFFFSHIGVDIISGPGQAKQTALKTLRFMIEALQDWLAFHHRSFASLASLKIILFLERLILFTNKLSSTAVLLQTSKNYCFMRLSIQAPKSCYFVLIL